EGIVMVWFGQRYTDARVWEQAAAWDALRPLRKELAATPVHAIIDVLDSFSSQWVPGSPAYNAALAELIKESGFNPQEVEKTLSILPTLLSRASLEKRLRSEFKPLSVLDGFVKTPGFAGKVKATPLGIVLHVTAGNVFLSSIDSLVMGLVTKNLSIVKVSGQNKFFPNFFAQKLIEHDERKIISNKFAILHWKGGERSIEDLFKKKVNGIIAWGGEEMIESYRKDLPPAVKFLDFGPKISVQVISREGLKDQDLSLV